MGQSVHDGALHVNGRLTASSFTPPSGSVSAASIPSGAGIETSKTVHRHKKFLFQAPGSAVVAATQDVAVLQASGTLIALEAAITGAVATGADRTVTIDVQKSTGEGAFATAMSATIVFNNATVLRRISSGTFSSTALVDGDLLRIVVTVAGAAGNQAQGLVVTLVFDENPQ